MSDVTIPEDVKRLAAEEALKYVEWLDPKPVEYDQAEHVLAASFARAILAERERCAKIADDEYEAMKRLDMGHMKIYATKSAEICGAKARTAESIAQAIRSSHD